MRGAATSQFRLGDISVAAGITAAYAVSAYLALFFVDKPTHIALIWPPSGILLGSLMATDRKRWPLILSGVFCIITIANYFSGTSFAVGIGYALANCLEGYVAALILIRVSGGDVKLTSVKQVILFVSAVLLASACASVLGALVSFLERGAPFQHAWITWWAADSAGILILVPPIAYARDRLNDGKAESDETTVPGGLISAFLYVAAAQLIFNNTGTDEYLLAPFTLLASLYMPPFLAVSSGVVVSVIALVNTATGHGPFIRFAGPSNIHLTHVQLFLCVNAVTSLLIIASLVDRRKRERELIRGKYRSEAVLRAGMDGFWIFDLEGRIQDVNDSYCLLSGYSREELLSMTIADIDADEESREIRQNSEAIVKAGSARFERRHRRKNGTVFDVEVSAQSFFLDNAVILVAFIRDITFRKRAETSLKKASERNEIMLQIHSVGPSLSEGELYNFTLERVVELTGSKIGFLHQVSDDETSIILTAWKSDTAKTRKAAHTATFPIAAAGYWVECVRLKQPVIYNDFQHSPNREGLPQGHVTVTRLLTMPVVVNGKTKVIIGVGNKIEQYDQTDLAHLQLVANELQKTIEQRATEDQLRKSEGELKRAQQIAHIGHWTWDAKNNHIEGSDEMLRIFGVERDGFKGDVQAIIQRLHPDDLQKMLTMIDAVIRDDLSPESEYRVVRPDGTARIVRVTPGHKITGRGGELIQLSGVVQDITERKQAELRLGRQRMLDSALADLYEPLIAPDITIEKITQVILDRARYLTGSEHGYVSAIDGISGVNVGHTLTQMLPNTCGVSEKIGHVSFAAGPDGKYPGLSGLSLNTRLPFFTNSPASHPASTGLPGGHIPMTRFLSVPVLLNNELVGQIALANSDREYTVDDVTAIQRLGDFYALAIQRYRSASALKESERRLREMLENFHLIAIMIDAQGSTLFVNDYLLSLTGWTREDVVGKDWFTLFDPHPEERRCKYLEAMTAGAIPQHEENVIVTRSGEKRRVNWNNTLLRGSNGEIIGFTSIGVDVTDHHNTQEQLRQAQKMEAIGTLAGGVAHDFNNILTAISGYAYLLSVDAPLDETQSAYVQEIITSIDRASRLTRSLLAFSRKQTVDLRMVSINDILLGMQKMLSRVIGEDVEFTVSISVENLVVEADQSQMEQVLMNLAANARDAMPDGGTLAMTTSHITVPDEGLPGFRFIKPGMYGLITVSDSGIGIPKDVQEHVFEPFFTTKEVGKGTGLGLSMVYGIVKKHDGYITISSEPGSGTSVKIYLPLRERDSVNEEDQSDKSMLHRGTETILLVEDDSAVRSMITRSLSKLGYRIIEAENGAEAEQRFKADPGVFDLLLTDLIMPGKNGRQVYEELKQLRPELKVLFMSGYAGDVLMQKGMQPDSFSFMLKPFDQLKFAEKIRELLDRAGSEDVRI